MTDLAGYYDESYPPSIYAPPAVPATGATAGIPGAWTPAGSSPPSSVANLIAGVPNAVVANPLTKWTIGQYVQTGTAGAAGQANWDGAVWALGVATFSTVGQTIAAVQAYIEALGAESDPAVIAETQRVLDDERAHGMRSTLIAWLDQRDGVV